MSTLGTLGLFLSCILLALSAGGSLWADGTRRRFLTLSRIAFHGAGAVVFWCLILLFSAFLLNDFSIRYVAEHSSLTTPWYYRLSALWAGPEGTLFLWLFLMLAGVSAAGFQIRGAQGELHRRVTLISSLISLALLAMILFFANPFAPKLIPVGDGLGLNPLLRDWAMILHPPILFAGYACLAVTFVFATSRFDDPVAALLSARWARLACGALTAGIVTGALWAYDELGWGGYWGWDPVENASLVPWLISFALLHFSSRRARVVTRSTVMLSGLAFAGTIVATYLTRSGIVFSLHAFADNSSAGIFLLALGVLTNGNQHLGLAEPFENRINIAKNPPPVVRFNPTPALSQRLRRMKRLLPIGRRNAQIRLNRYRPLVLLVNPQGIQAHLQPSGFIALLSFQHQRFHRRRRHARHQPERQNNQPHMGDRHRQPVQELSSPPHRIKNNNDPVAGQDKKPDQLQHVETSHEKP